MTTEQKAKAYDEALERAKKQLEEAKVFDYEEGQIAYDIRTTTYAIFPELSESEDERMIRVICLALTDVPEGRFTMEGTSLAKVLAWLEKQKEQKSVEWSEEDEEKRDDIVKIIEYSTTIPAYGKTGTLKLSKEYKKELTDWLKSLKPQPKQKPEVKHIGWVARDSEHDSYLGLGLVLFKGKPIRSGDCWTGIIDSQLPWESFPDLKWEDEPLEVEVEVTIKKKNTL